MTKTGIKLLDLYILTYCGLRVVFQVCKTTNTSVWLIELAVKRYKDGYCLTKKYRASKNPLVIAKNNVFTQSKYRVQATRIDKKIPIKIDASVELYWRARQYKSGMFLAVPFKKEDRDKYWVEEQCSIIN